MSEILEVESVIMTHKELMEDEVIRFVKDIFASVGKYFLMCNYSVYPNKFVVFENSEYTIKFEIEDDGVIESVISVTDTDGKAVLLKFYTESEELIEEVESYIYSYERTKRNMTFDAVKESIKETGF